MKYLAAYMFGLAVGIVVTIVVTAWVASNEFEDKTTIVSHKCAHYDSQTGTFTWNQ